LLPGHLELDQAEWQPIDEGENVGAAVPVVLLDRHLVDHGEVVALWTIPVDHPGYVVAQFAGRSLAGDGHTLSQQSMHAPVLREHVGAFRPAYRGDDLGHCLAAQPRVEPGNGSGEPSLQQDIAVRRPLRGRLVRSDLRSVQDLPAETGEVVEADLLDARLGDEGLHSRSPSRLAVTPTTESVGSDTINLATQPV